MNFSRYFLHTPCTHKVLGVSLWIVLLFSFGCHSLDDDAKFQKHTQGYVLYTKQGNNYTLLYAPLKENAYSLPVSVDSSTQNLLCIDNELFIPQRNLRAVQVFDMSSMKMKQTIFFENDFYPVSIIQHPDKPEWFFIASENGKIAFYNRKKDKKEILTYTNYLNHLVYANNKLYGTSKNKLNNEFIVVDVPTRALIKKETISSGIQQIYSQTLWVKGFSSDSLPVLYTFNVNDDILQKSTYTYPLQQYAYSPYTQQFYGREFIGFVEYYQGKVYVNQVVLSNADYLQGFLADFDESRMIVYSNSKIYHYQDMRNLVHIDSSMVNTSILHGTVYRK